MVRITVEGLARDAPPSTPLRPCAGHATLARMALALHRFPLSPYSEKARAALDFKGLDYTVVDHTPGRDQLAVYRLSGQRKVPVLVHDGEAIADSTAIALHLDRAFSARDGRRALLPDELSARRAVLDYEEQLDTVFSPAASRVALVHAARERDLFDLLVRLGVGLSDGYAPAVRALGLVTRASTLIPSARRALDEATATVERTLADLCARLDRTAFLFGDTPTLADVAAVGLALPLKYPQSAHLADARLAGRGATALFEDPRYRRFFTWREAFYREFLR